MATGIEVAVTSFPDCDLCVAEGYRPVRKAKYDFKTLSGPWANGCTTHYYQHRVYKELGTGKGQMLVLK